MRIWAGKTAFEKWCITALAVSFACSFTFAAFMVAGSIYCGNERDCMRAIVEAPSLFKTALQYGAVGSWVVCLALILTKSVYKMIREVVRY